MREAVTGITLMVGGAAYAFAAIASLPLGSLRQMGPGMFPVGLGGILFLIGAGILIGAWFQTEKLPSVNWRALAAVLAALAAFALLIEHFGLLPAIAASTVLSSLAAPGSKPLGVLWLSVALMFVAWLIFVLILQLPVPVLAWEI